MSSVGISVHAVTAQPRPFPRGTVETVDTDLLGGVTASDIVCADLAAVTLTAFTLGGIGAVCAPASLSNGGSPAGICLGVGLGALGSSCMFLSGSLIGDVAVSNNAELRRTGSAGGANDGETEPRADVVARSRGGGYTNSSASGGMHGGTDDSNNVAVTQPDCGVRQSVMGGLSGASGSSGRRNSSGNAVNMGKHFNTVR